MQSSVWVGEQREGCPLHSVRALAVRISGLIRSIQLVINLNVKIALVLCVRLVGKISCHTLAFFDCENFAEVEDSLFPVGIFGMRTGREPNRFVTGRKIDVEPGNKRVDKIISLATE